MQFILLAIEAVCDGPEEGRVDGRTDEGTQTYRDSPYKKIILCIIITHFNLIHIMFQCGERFFQFFFGIMKWES